MTRTIITTSILITLGFITTAAAQPVWPPEPSETSDHDYAGWYAARVRGDAAPADNAYDKLHATLSSLEPAGMDILRLRPWNPQDDTTAKRSEEWLTDKMKLIRAAAKKPYYFPPTDRAVLPPEMPRQEYHKLVRNVILTAWRAPDGKLDTQRFVNRLDLAHQLGKHLLRVPSVESQLAGATIQAEVAQCIQAAVAQDLLPAKRLRDALTLLQTMNPAQPFAKTTLAGELAGDYAFIQAALTPGRVDFGEPLNSTAYLLRAGNISQNRTIRTLRQYRQRVSETAHLPFTMERNSRLAKHHQDARENAVTSVLAALYTREYPLAARLEAERRATAVVVGLQLTRQERGQWPETLDKLAIELEPRWTTDPFSGKPYQYQIKAGQPQLYSVGLDGEDDGGRHMTLTQQTRRKPVNGDFVLWPQPMIRTASH